MIHDRAEQPVVEEQPIVTEIAHVDAEQRAPRRVDGREVREANRDVLASIELHVGDAVVTHDRRGEQHGEQRRDEPHRPCSRRDQRGERERPAREHHARGRADRRLERHDDRARDPGTDQVGEVQAVDALGPAPEHRGEHDPRGHERREQGQADDGELHAVRDRAAPVIPERERVHRHPRHDQIAERNRDRAGHEAREHDRSGSGLAEPSRHRDGDAAHAEAEQRQADHEIREVVEELVRHDPRVADLEQQPGEAHEEHFGVVASARAPAASGAGVAAPTAAPAVAVPVKKLCQSRGLRRLLTPTPTGRRRRGIHRPRRPSPGTAPASC